jgi:hypothetical protein
MYISTKFHARERTLKKLFAGTETCLANGLSKDKIRYLQIGKTDKPTCLHITVVGCVLTQLRPTDVKAVHEASVIRQQRNTTLIWSMANSHSSRKKKSFLCAFAALRSPHSTNPKWDTSSPRLQPFVLT